MTEQPGHKRELLSTLWAVVCVALIAIAGAWCAATLGNMELRNRLARWTVVSLDLSLVLIVCALLSGWQSIREAVAAISRNTVIGLVVILLAGITLVAVVAPRTNRIFFDEHIYQNIAQSIAWTGKAFVCHEGEAEYGEYRPFAVEYNKEPAGHPYFTSLFFRLFGIKEWVAHVANNAAYLLAVLSVFGTVLFLFHSERAALFASIFFAATPVVVQWSNTASSEPSAAALGAFAMCAAAFYTARPSRAALLLLAGAAVFAVQMRPESILLLLPLLLVLLLNKPLEFLRPHLCWAVALFLLLALPGWLHLYAVRNEGWGAGGEKFALTILWQNLPVNGLFYFQNERYPLAFSVFALLGLFAGRGWKSKTPIVLWLLCMWGVFLFFYAGSYNYGADVRFSVVAAAPLAVLEGLGASWLSSRKPAFLGSRALTVVVIVVTAVLWMKFLPLIRAVGQEAVDARFDVQYGRELAGLVPVDSIVLAHNPSMWLLWGKNAAQISTATYNRGHVDNDFFKRYSGGVYMHWNFWCNIADPAQNQFGANIMKDYATELVREYKARNFRYALYRLHPKGRVAQEKTMVTRSELTLPSR